MVIPDIANDADATQDVDDVRSDLEGFESAMEEKDYESAHDIVAEAISDLQRIQTYCASKIPEETE